MDRRDVTKVYVPDFDYVDNFCLNNILLKVLTSHYIYTSMYEDMYMVDFRILATCLSLPFF